MKKFGKLLGVLSVLSIGLVLLSSCSSGEGADKAADDKKAINLSYVEWDSEIASTHVIGQVLEDLGYDVTLTPLDNAIMWESVSTGDTDAMVSAWLPNTHESQYAEYEDKVENLGENLKGAKIGLVVPTYMDVDSIADLKDEASQTITGIEPGAGVVAAAENALEDYDNLADWTVDTSSSGAMTTALAQALKKEEPIIVTGWSPHWKFAEYDLKYLEDPKESFGGVETINTITRKGLKDDLPEAYEVLDKFHWTTEDMEAVMLEIHEGKDPKDAAKDWVKDNEDKVAEWIK